MCIRDSPQTVPASSERFKSYRGKVKQYTADGKYRYKYCVGEYETRYSIFFVTKSIIG